MTNWVQDNDPLYVFNLARVERSGCLIISLWDTRLVFHCHGYQGCYIFFDCFHIARFTCSRSCHFPPLICESQRSPSLPPFSRLVNPMAYPTRPTPPTCSHLCLPRYFPQFLPSHSFAVSLVWLDISRPPLGILINSGIVLVSFHLLWPESRDTCTFGSSLGFTPVSVVPSSQSSRLGFVRN